MAVLTRPLNLLIGLFSALCLAVPSQAGLIGADSYVIGTDPTAGEYETITLKDQPSNLTNLGFVDGPYSSGTGTSQFAATDTGLNYAPLGESSATSGKVNYSAAALDNIYRANARNSSGLSGSSTYWITHLVNRGGIPESGGNGYVLSGIGNFVAPDLGATSGTLEGAFVGFRQDETRPDSFGDLVIRSRVDPANTSADEVLIDGSVTSTFGNTYAVVMKAEINVAGGQDRISWWLDPTIFLNESTLTSSSAASGSFLNYAYGSTTLGRLNYSSRNWNGNAFFDGVKVSTTLEGLGGEIPEPSTVVMVTLAGLGLVATRLRRK